MAWSNTHTQTHSILFCKLTIVTQRSLHLISSGALQTTVAAVATVYLQDSQCVCASARTSKWQPYHPSLHLVRTYRACLPALVVCFHQMVFWKKKQCWPVGDELLVLKTIRVAYLLGKNGHLTFTQHLKQFGYFLITVNFMYLICNRNFLTKLYASFFKVL